MLKGNSLAIQNDANSSERKQYLAELNEIYRKISTPDR